MQIITLFLLLSSTLQGASSTPQHSLFLARVLRMTEGDRDQLYDEYFAANVTFSFEEWGEPLAQSSDWCTQRGIPLAKESQTVTTSPEDEPLPCNLDPNPAADFETYEHPVTSPAISSPPDAALLEQNQMKQDVIKSIERGIQNKDVSPWNIRSLFSVSDCTDDQTASVLTRALPFVHGNDVEFSNTLLDAFLTLRTQAVKGPLRKLPLRPIIIMLHAGINPYQRSPFIFGSNHFAGKIQSHDTLTDYDKEQILAAVKQKYGDDPFLFTMPPSESAQSTMPLPKPPKQFNRAARRQRRVEFAPPPLQLEPIAEAPEDDFSLFDDLLKSTEPEEVLNGLDLLCISRTAENFLKLVASRFGENIGILSTFLRTCDPNYVDLATGYSLLDSYYRHHHEMLSRTVMQALLEQGFNPDNKPLIGHSVRTSMNLTNQQKDRDFFLGLMAHYAPLAEHRQCTSPLMLKRS